MYGILQEFSLQSALNPGKPGKLHRVSKIAFMTSLSDDISGIEITFI